MIRVNLIPHQRRARAEARRRGAAWARFLRAYAIVLAFVCALALFPAHATPPSLESSIARVNRNIDSSTKALEGVKNQAGMLARQVEVARIIRDHPDWSLLLAAVAEIAKGPSAGAQESQLRSFDLSIAKIEEKSAKAAAAKSDKPLPAHDIVIVKLVGAAPTLESCIKCVKALEDRAVFDQVTLKDTHAETVGHAAVTRFEIEATIDCGSAPDKPAAAPSAQPEKGGAK